ncbi:MAG: YaiO family outer membrane beta-barrel protein [Vampirovibrionales bacterium]
MIMRRFLFSSLVVALLSLVLHAGSVVTFAETVSPVTTTAGEVAGQSADMALTIGKLLEEASKAVNAKQYAKAESLYRELMARYPQNTNVYVRLAALLQRQGKVQDAEAVRMTARQKFNNPYWAYSYLPPASGNRSAWEKESLARLQAASLKEPNNPEIIFLMGNVTRFAGQSEDAVKYYDKALVIKSDYMDAKIGKANALNAIGKHADAVALFQNDMAQIAVKGANTSESTGEAVALLATEAGGITYVGKPTMTQEAFETLLRSQARAGDKKGVEATALLAQDAFPERAWQNEFKDSPAGNKWNQSAEVYYGFDALSRDGFANWNEQGVRYSIQTPNQKTTYRVGITRNERFDNTDISYNLGASHKLTEKLTAFGDVTFGPGNRIVPQLIVQPGLSYKLPYGITVSGMYRFFQYTSQTNHSGIYTVEKSIKPLGMGIGYTFRHVSVENVSKTPVTHTAFINKYYRNNSFMSARIFTGDGVEFVRTPAIAGRVITYDTIGFGFGGTHFLTKTSPWAVTWGVNYQNLEGLFARTGYNIGLRRNF